MTAVNDTPNATSGAVLPGGAQPAAAQPGATQPAAAQPANSAAPGLTQGQLALYAGWTMAVLYGLGRASTASASTAGASTAGASTAGASTAGHAAPASLTLPTVFELEPGLRTTLEYARLKDLLSGLLPASAAVPAISKFPPEDIDHRTQASEPDLTTQNFELLKELTDMPPTVQLAYQLGRSLRDTANPPGGAKDIVAQLKRDRIAQIQEWLVTLAPEFPQLTAAVVAASLGRWSELAGVTIAKPEPAKPGTAANQQPAAMPAPQKEPRRQPGLPGTSKLPKPERQPQIQESMGSYLLKQGDVWLMLLTGELKTDGLLTPEGYVAAGEAALHRLGVMVRSIIRHYWLGLLCIAGGMVAALILAADLLQGGGRVWTSIASIVGGLGVSAQTIRSTTSRLAAETTRPVFAMAEEDAMAWAITTMPPLKHLTIRGVRHLRRAGVAPTASLGRF